MLLSFCKPWTHPPWNLVSSADLTVSHLLHLFLAESQCCFDKDRDSQLNYTLACCVCVYLLLILQRALTQCNCGRFEWLLAALFSLPRENGCPFHFDPRALQKCFSSRGALSHSKIPKCSGFVHSVKSLVVAICLGSPSVKYPLSL